VIGAAILLVALQWSSLASAQTQARILLQHGAVHGFRYYDGKAVWKQMKVHDPLSLVREPDNPYDAKAVRVNWQGHKLGYVPRDDNVDLARLIDNGNRVEARITQLTKGRRPNNRVQLEIYLPMQASSQR
jgi:hypothetical protein